MFLLAAERNGRKSSGGILLGPLVFGQGAGRRLEFFQAGFDYSQFILDRFDRVFGVDVGHSLQLTEHRCASRSVSARRSRTLT